MTLSSARADIEAASSTHEEAMVSMRLLRDQMKDPASLNNPNHLATFLYNLAQLDHQMQQVSVNIQGAWESVTAGQVDDEPAAAE